MKNKFIFNVMILLGLCLLTITGGCSTAKKGVSKLTNKDNCIDFDWYKAGYEDGLNGKPISEFQRVNEICVTSTSTPNQEYYMAGRSRGLKAYCTKDRAIEAGRKNEEYHFVCPIDSERTFLVYYKTGKWMALGKDVTTLSQENQELQEKVKSLELKVKILKSQVGE
jgi:hypothetical protein